VNWDFTVSQLGRIRNHAQRDNGAERAALDQELMTEAESATVALLTSRCFARDAQNKNNQ
jgi:hypothetical protein